MRDVQPPITNDEELARYCSGLAAFTTIVAATESELFTASTSNDLKQIEHARESLLRLYRRHQGIVDAITAYERQQAIRQHPTHHTAQQET